MRFHFLLIFGFALFASPALAQQAESVSPLTMLGTIRDKRISESSGLALSLNTPDAFWTLNDSGHPSDVYLVAKTGATLATCDLKKSKNRDWEAMGSFQQDGQPWLMVADVGDNGFNRATSQIYLFPEPAQVSVKGKKKSKSKSKKKKKAVELSATPLKLEFRYQDGQHNVEAAAVCPDDESVWLIEKIYSNDTRSIQPGIYRLPTDRVFASPPDIELGSPTDPEPAPLSVATRIADYPIRNVTGMSFSPDGHRLIVRNYLNAHVFTRTAGTTWEQTVKSTRPVPVILPLQSQGEAITFCADSNSVLITSEFRRSAIWKVELPPALDADSGE